MFLWVHLLLEVLGSLVELGFEEGVLCDELLCV